MQKPSHRIVVREIATKMVFTKKDTDFGQMLTNFVERNLGVLLLPSPTVEWKRYTHTHTHTEMIP